MCLVPGTSRKYLDRPSSLARLIAALRRSPVTALLGPRQCGKTTLARMLGRNRRLIYFDLEHEADRSRLQNPGLVLGPLRGTVVLDEAQRVPEVFSALRVLVDRPGNRARYLILGSASPSLVRGVSESLAGRMEFVELAGFALSEIGLESWERLWIRGGFPRSFLARSDADSLAWRESFIRTFLERDVPRLGIAVPAPAMRGFKCTCATRESCTAYWVLPTATAFSDIPRPAPPGKALLSNRPSERSSLMTRISGQLTEAPSWICSSSTGGIGSGSDSGSPTLRG